MTRLVLALLAGFAAASCSGGGDVGDGGRLAWQKDPQQGIEHARTTGKPMLLYFTSDG